MTFVTFIEVLNNGSFKKVVETSSRTAEKFCIDACEYYKSKGIETEVRISKKDPRFCGVFSCKNDKIMAVAGPEKNEFFWSNKFSIGFSNFFFSGLNIRP